MFDSAVLEVAIGLFFAYAVLSLFCSSITEWIARFRARRSRSLEGGIRCLLGDDAVARDIVERFYRHPLIQGFAKPGWFDRQFREGESRPSYIPNHDFSLALFDIVSASPGAPRLTTGAGSPVRPVAATAGGPPAATADPAAAGVAPAATNAAQPAAPGDPVSSPGPPKPMDMLRDGVARIGDSQTGRALRVLLQDAAASPVPDEWQAARSKVEKWFDSGMARVSGQYKRNSQTIIVVVALALAAGLNVDTIDLSRRLWANEAEPGATNGETVVTAVAQEIPIGWTDESTDDLDGWWGVWKVFGLLLTVVATSLGAPFWFDLLNKIVNVRQSGTLPVTFQDTGGV